YYSPEPTPASEPVAAPEPAPAASDSIVRRVFEAASSALVVVGTDGAIREANATALRVLGREGDAVGQDFADLFLGEDARVEGRQALRAALNAPAGEAEPITARDPEGGGVLWRILPLDGAEGADALLLAGERWDEVAEAEPEVIHNDTAEDAGAEAARPSDAEPVVDEAAIQARIDAAVAAALDAQTRPDAVDVTEAASREAERQARIEEALADAAEARALARQAQLDEHAARQAVETARAEAEDARQAAARARSEAEAELSGGRRMESVGRLTGGVAHDFNALLGVMTSALDMILRQADDPSRVKRLGQAALAAGQRGEVLTRRLAAFSQGEDEPVLQVMDAGVLLKAMEARLRAQAGPGVDLLIEGPSDVATARLDPVAFEGAVRALVANAVEAVDGQGSVAVRLETLMEGGLRLSVRDSGPGMDRELAARALEPFFTTKEGASGLGLSQAYAFARQSSGVLSIDSVEGEGAEVSITLPSADQGAAG
ncbi:MAG: PAS domain-containing sensor histidine kinase, partial [Brevundimonas sp.]